MPFCLASSCSVGRPNRVSRSPETDPENLEDFLDYLLKSRVLRGGMEGLSRPLEGLVVA